MHVALYGQWRYSINTEKLPAAMQIAEASLLVRTATE